MGRRKARPASAQSGGVIALGIFLLGLWVLPGLALLTFITLGAIALGTWFLGSQAMIAQSRRWRAVTNFLELTPQAFEQHVADTFSALGYRVQVTPRINDQGVDVVARRGDEVLAIICKQLPDGASITTIQQVLAGKTYYGCNKALAIGLGGFSQNARDLARSAAVDLLDGQQYAAIVQQAAPSGANRQWWRSQPSGRLRSLWLLSSVGALIALAIALGHRS